MAGDSIASFLYLALLGAAVFGFFIVQNRQSLSRTLQQLALWGLIFVGVIAGAALWSDIRDEVLPPRQAMSVEGSLVVPQSYDGHFRVILGIEGTPVEFIVDTGASDLVLSRRDAQRIGIDPDRLAYLGRAQTANGVVPLARVSLGEVRLGDMVERGVPAMVNGGDMSGSLMGMSYLQHFGRIEIADGRLTLTR
ncbi:TIGR02281 family clan AA aspartic protease [Palleronia sediminis]|uniref:TIGR02281 family clan AA aspartic protease n=1 Tax=Palleronia sediminis TaxID=2547833 RepID=A0A4R6A969_9RHOB|nr:TIGR02281 family clan AA aspartic protease [Palleronia sediminis]TDL79497.1 TIGR02281 family clan AA aspartic protease [Palleronia sediminis]